MDPTTDLSTQVKLANGHIVTVIQPGGRIPKSRNWRLNEAAYRAYASHITEAVNAWPVETKFDIPSGMSPNTFEHRLRDALQAVKAFGYDPVIQTRLAEIRDELVVSMDPAGTAVWIRAKGKAGRPVQLKSSRQTHGVVSAVESIQPNPDRDTLHAWCTLIQKKVRSEPVQFRGKVDQTLVEALQINFDVAFTYDETQDVTILL